MSLLPQPTPEYAPFDPAAFAADFESALAVPEPEDYSWLGEPTADGEPEEEEIDLEGFVRDEELLIAGIGAYNLENPPDFQIEDPVLAAAAELAAQLTAAEPEAEAPAPWDNPELWADVEEDAAPWERPELFEGDDEDDEPAPAAAPAIDPALADLFSEIAKPVSDDELNSLISQAVESGFSGSAIAEPEAKPMDSGPAEEAEGFELAQAAALMQVRVAAPNGGVRLLAASGVAALREEHPDLDVQPADPGEILRALRQASLRRDAELCRAALAEGASGPSLLKKIWNWVKS